MRGTGQRRHHRRHQPDGGAAARWQQGAVRGHARGHRPGPRLAGAGLLRGQAGRTAGPPPQVPRHRLQPGTQRQGKPGRPARHPDDRLGGQAPLRLRHPAWAGGMRLPHRTGVSDADRGPGLPLAHPLRPAQPHRPPRGPAAVRPSAHSGRAVRLPAGRRAAAGGRTLHARLLPHGDGAGTAERDAAATVQGAHPARRRQRRPRAHQPPFPGTQGLHRSHPSAGLRTLPLRPAGGLPAHGRTPGTPGRARRHHPPDPRPPAPDRRRLPQRPARPQPVHGADETAARRHPRASAHEPLRGAGGLHPGLRADRRPHAVRPLPCLHGGRTHPLRGAQPAPLHGARVRPRAALRQRTHQDHPQAGAAAARRPVPRHRQGPRRRPLGTRRRGRRNLLPAPRPEPPRRRPGRLAGTQPPAHVHHRPAPRHQRPGRNCRIRPHGGRTHAAGLSLPAHRGRHPRHQQRIVE